MDIPLLILSILFMAIAGILILLIVSKFSDNPWFCTTMGWHEAPASPKSDGFQSSGVCPRCGKEVILDSQGNWF